MPILTPTAATGASAKAGPMVYIDPTRLQVPNAFENLFGDDGMNGVFIADLLSDMLAHERAGAHLYQSVQGRTLNAVLEERYEHFGTETRTHVEILEELIAEVGGDPRYVSPSARATEKSGMAVLESTYLLAGSVDALTRELVMLEAVFLAEAKDQANWETFRQLVTRLPEDARALAANTVDDVANQEDEHLTWARETRARLVLLLAETPASPPVVTPSDELIARIEGLLA